jgi:hypothetical protein
VGASALLCAATFSMSATASATSTPVPIDPTNPLFIPLGPPPPVGSKGTTFVNCSPAVETSFAAIEFVDGNGHMYGPTTHPLTNGGNAEGNAYWLGFDADPTKGPANVTYTYYGEGHAWFGQNNYPLPTGGPTPGSNAEVQAQTFMFHGTGVEGTSGSIDVQGSFGSTQSASGHPSGWGHLKVTCS